MAEPMGTGAKDRDCGDNACRYAKNLTGMRTNGGCTCDQCPGCGKNLRLHNHLEGCQEGLARSVIKPSSDGYLCAESVLEHADPSGDATCIMYVLGVLGVLRLCADPRDHCRVEKLAAQYLSGCFSGREEVRVKSRDLPRWGWFSEQQFRLTGRLALYKLAEAEQVVATTVVKGNSVPPTDFDDFVYQGVVSDSIEEAYLSLPNHHSLDQQRYS